MKNRLEDTINKIWQDRSLVKEESANQAIIETLEMLDKGKLRIAEKINNEWKVNEWIKKAVVLYFVVQKMEVTEVGPFEFHDKIALKKFR